MAGTHQQWTFLKINLYADLSGRRLCQNWTPTPPHCSFCTGERGFGDSNEDDADDVNATILIWSSILNFVLLSVTELRTWDVLKRKWVEKRAITDDKKEFLSFSFSLFHTLRTKKEATLLWFIMVPQYHYSFVELILPSPFYPFLSFPTFHLHPPSPPSYPYSVTVTYC